MSEGRNRVRDAQYQLLLLNTERRQCPTMDSATFAIICLVVVPMMIFCFIYALLFGVYETVLYPKSYVLSVPTQWVERARRYNDYDAKNLTENYKFLDRAGGSSKTAHPSTVEASSSDFKLVCYYVFPNGHSYDLYPMNIDPHICTHVNVGMASVANNILSLTDDQLAVVVSVVQLKKYNKDLKVLLTVGGSGSSSGSGSVDDEYGFAGMVRNHSNRKMFIKSAHHLIRSYKLDGIDLDWEFPNDEESDDKNQVLHFTQLLEEFRITINRQPWKNKFLLSVAVAAPAIIADISYRIPEMNRFVDYINLMSYDYHFFTSMTPFTGLNSPLYPLDSEKNYLSTLNINYSAHHWHSMGMDRKKIVVGLPTYGHSFTLTNSLNNGIYAPAKGYGHLGNRGFIDYYQVCSFLYVNQLCPVFETDAKSPYATKVTEWISFEDEQSLLYKAEYIRDNNFGGAMVYCLNTDNHKGLCKSSTRSDFTNFPLTRVIKRVLFNRTAAG